MSGSGCPEPEEVKDQEYQSDDLNKLMQSYKENAAKRDAFFEEDKRQKMAKAASEVQAAKAANGTVKAKAPVFGLSPTSAETEDTKTMADSLFGGSGAPDLAIARKTAAAIAVAASLTESKDDKISFA